MRAVLSPLLCQQECQQDHDAARMEVSIFGERLSAAAARVPAAAARVPAAAHVPAAAREVCQL